MEKTQFENKNGQHFMTMTWLELPARNGRSSLSIEEKIKSKHDRLPARRELCGFFFNIGTVINCKPVQQGVGLFYNNKTMQKKNLMHWKEVFVTYKHKYKKRNVNSMYSLEAGLTVWPPTPNFPLKNIFF